jgi:hypothetical protein
MDIYRLTPQGEMVSHTIRPNLNKPRSPYRWAIIYRLREGCKDKDSLLDMTGASSGDLSYLQSKGVITKRDEVVI